MPRATEQCVRDHHVRSGGDNSQCYTCSALEQDPDARSSIVIAVDPASPGGDETAYACRIGLELIPIERWQYRAIVKFLKSGKKAIV